MSGHNDVNHPIDIYFFPPSPPSRAVLLLIRILKLKHNIITTNPAAGDNKTSTFLKLNPLHTIPVINDNGFILYDSHVILKYLVDVYGPDDSLYPKDPKKGALVNLRLHFSACYLFPIFLDYHSPTIYFGHPPCDQAMDKLKDVLEHLNDFLESQNFVAGQELTVADFSIITIISTIEAAETVNLKAFPNIWIWIKRTKKELDKFGYEQITQGAQAFGILYKNKLADI